MHPDLHPAEKLRRHALVSMFVFEIQHLGVTEPSGFSTEVMGLLLAALKIGAAERWMDCLDAMSDVIHDLQIEEPLISTA